MVENHEDNDSSILGRQGVNYKLISDERKHTSYSDCPLRHRGSVLEVYTLEMEHDDNE